MGGRMTWPAIRDTLAWLGTTALLWAVLVMR